MNLSELKKEQLKLAKKVILKDKFRKIKTIGGCDQTFFDDKIISAILIFKYPSLEIIEKRYSIVKEKFPYIPGYLSYREVPSIIKTYKKLKNKPDVLLCDFNGILHPRKIGAASHLGVLLNICTIGVTKSLLCGEVKEGYVYLNKKNPNSDFLYPCDEPSARLQDNEKVGYELKRKNFRPVYISPGNKISLKTSIKIVKGLIKENKLPEPLRLAHLYANEIKKEKRFFNQNNNHG